MTDRVEYLNFKDPFWRRYPASIETVIVSNETGGCTTVHKCWTKAEQRLEVIQDPPPGRMINDHQETLPPGPGRSHRPISP